MSQKPSIGRIVHVLVDPAINNGSDVAPAVITRVWSESGPDRWCVNYRLLLDALPSDQEWRTSAYLHADLDAVKDFTLAEGMAEAWQKPAVDIAEASLKTGMHSFWPPRD
jgi:hypothetical protein